MSARDYNGIVHFARCGTCKTRFSFACPSEIYGWQQPSSGQGRKYFCSYSCMRQYERKRLERGRTKIERDLQGIPRSEH